MDIQKLKDNILVGSSTKADSNTFFKRLHSQVKPSLKDLSNDLKFLYESKRMSDVTLLLSSGTTIKCHKAILYARSAIFALLLGECEDGILTYPGVKDSVMDAILRYVYTGDLTVFVQTFLPLNLAYEAAATLQLRCAKNFLTTQLSTIQAERIPAHELHFQVHLPEFSNSPVNTSKEYEYEFPSGIMWGLDEWKLKIRLYRVHATHVYLGVFLSRKCIRNVMHLVWVKISLIDVDGNESFTFSDEFIFTRDTQFGSPLFVERQTLRDHCKKYLPNDILTFNCDLNIVYDYENKFCSSGYELFKLIDAKDHRLHFSQSYNCLSKNFLKFYDQKLYTDFNFKCRETTYELHKCILTVRTSLSVSGVEMLFSRLSQSSLDRYINFVYSGQGKYIKRCATSIYSIVSTLGFSLLAVRSSEFLAHSLTEENALCILRKSFLYNDENLKYAALHFITKNKKILLSDDWSQLLRENLHIALEVRSYRSQKLKFSEFVHSEYPFALNFSRRQV